MQQIIGCCFVVFIIIFSIGCGSEWQVVIEHKCIQHAAKNIVPTSVVMWYRITEISDLLHTLLTSDWKKLSESNQRSNTHFHLRF